MIRDPVSSRWPDRPVQIDGRATEWSDNPVLQEEGFSFRAMNDASNLYLLIGGETREEEMVLSGKYRQDVTLWFVKPDETSRTWGINLDFNHIHPPETSTDTAHPTPVTLSSIGVVPEWVNAQGLVLSTASLPAGLELQDNLFHQNGQPSLYEIKIPLGLIEHQAHSILLDFVTSQVNPDVIKRLQSDAAGQRSNVNGDGDASGGDAGGGRHHKGGGSKGGSHSPSIEAPNPVDLHLEISLTQELKR